MTRPVITVLDSTGVPPSEKVVESFADLFKAWKPTNMRKLQNLEQDRNAPNAPAVALRKLADSRMLAKAKRKR